MNNQYMAVGTPKTPYLNRNKSGSNQSQDIVFNTTQQSMKKLKIENNDSIDQSDLIEIQQQQQYNQTINNGKKRIELQRIVSKRPNLNQFNDFSQSPSNSNTKLITCMAFNRKNSLNSEKMNQTLLFDNKCTRSSSNKHISLKDYFSTTQKSGYGKTQAKKIYNPYFSVNDIQNTLDKKQTYETSIPTQIQEKMNTLPSKIDQDVNIIYEQKNLVNLVEKITNQSKLYQNTSMNEQSSYLSYIPQQIHNETMIRNCKVALPNIVASSINMGNVDMRNYADMSNIENHQANLLDQKVKDKDYFDTPLLNSLQLKQIEATRIYKDQILLQQIGYKNFEYNKDIDHIKKVEKGKIINIQDLSQLDINKDQASKLLSSFQNNCQKSLLHVPLSNKTKNITSRKDVEDLELWLNEMTLQVVQDNQSDGQGLFQNLQQIYSACLHELIRQVSLQCVERGALIRKIWDSYIGLFQKIIKKKSDETLKLESQYLAESTRLHKNYQAQIKDLEAKLSESVKNCENIQEKYKKMKFLHVQSSDRVKQLEVQNSKQINEINELKYNIQMIQNDNSRIANYLKEIGVIDEGKMNNNKISLDQLQPSDFLGNNQTNDNPQNEKFNLKKISGLQRSISYNSVLNEGTISSKRKAIQDEYYRIKSDPTILQNAENISQSDDNNKGVDTQELNSFAESELVKLQKKVKILIVQLAQSKQQTKTLQIQNSKVKSFQHQSSSNSITQNKKSLHGNQDLQRVNTKDAFSLSLKSKICPNCNFKLSENQSLAESILHNSPLSSPSKRKSIYQQLESTVMKDNNKSIAILDLNEQTLSKESSKEEGRKRINFQTNTKSNLTRSFDENQDTKVKSIIIEYNYNPGDSSKQIQSSIMDNMPIQKQGKSKGKVSKNSPSLTKIQSDKKKDTRIKESLESKNLNSARSSYLDKDEFEKFLGEFYEEAGEYNIETGLKLDEISNLAKSLELLSQNADQNANIKQFLVHFGQAREYLNKKMLEINTNRNQQSHLYIKQDLQSSSKLSPREQIPVKSNNNSKRQSQINQIGLQYSGKVKTNNSIQNQTPKSNTNKQNFQNSPKNNQTFQFNNQNSQQIPSNSQQNTQYSQQSTQQNSQQSTQRSQLNPSNLQLKNQNSQQNNLSLQLNKSSSQQLKEFSQRNITSPKGKNQNGSSQNLKQLKLEQVPSIQEVMDNYSDSQIKQDSYNEQIQKIIIIIQTQQLLIEKLLNYIDQSNLPEDIQQLIQQLQNLQNNFSLKDMQQFMQFQLSNHQDGNKRTNQQNLPSSEMFIIHSKNEIEDDNSFALKKKYGNDNSYQNQQGHAYNQMQRNNQNIHKENKYNIEILPGYRGDDTNSQMRSPQINGQIFSNTPKIYGGLTSHDGQKGGDATTKKFKSPYSKNQQNDQSSSFSQQIIMSQVNIKPETQGDYIQYDQPQQNTVLYAKKGDKKKNERNISTNQEASFKIVKEVLERKRTNQIKAYFSKINLIKFISIVYIERIKIAQNYNNRLFTIAYDYLLNKYGLKRVAEKKLAQYLETCYYFADIHRIKLFANFSQLFNNSSCFDKDEFNFYINMLKHLDEKTNSGIGLVQNYNDRIFCSLEKVIEYIQTYFEKESEKYDQQIIEQINQRALNIGNQFFVDVDEAFSIIVNLYQGKKQEIGNNVKKVFYAADLDKNECIEMNEFITIYRYLESESFNKNQVEQLFLNSADIITNEGIKSQNQFIKASEKAISLDRFAAVCLDNQLFSLSKQQKFSQSYNEKEEQINLK